jgi:hypothetical protein
MVDALSRHEFELKENGRAPQHPVVESAGRIPESPESALLTASHLLETVHLF